MREYMVGLGLSVAVGLEVANKWTNWGEVFLEEFVRECFPWIIIKFRN